jgi:hypothetical protein
MKGWFGAGMSRERQVHVSGRRRILHVTTQHSTFSNVDNGVRIVAEAPHKSICLCRPLKQSPNRRHVIWSSLQHQC